MYKPRMIVGWILAILGAAMALLVGPSAKRPGGGLWPSGWAAIILGGLVFCAGVVLAVASVS